MTRTRSIMGVLALATLALLTACTGAKTGAKAAATTDTTAAANSAKQTKRPKILQPIDRARATSDSMAARTARMNAATDSIIH